MERDLGEEMARTFGSRLRRIYDEDSREMPSEIAASLARLKNAEERTGDGVVMNAASDHADDKASAV